MLIIKLMGGLGNQMQQYALCRKLQTLGREAKLDTSWFEDEKLQKSVLAPRSLELRYFRNLSLQTASAEEIRKVRGASTLPAKAFRRLTGKTTVFTESKMYHPEIFSMDGRYLEGYFACNKYYADILPLLREEFVFPESKDPARALRNKEVIRQMEDASEISVSIHLRRGDYLAKENAALLGGICTPAYYDGAVRFLEQRAESAGKRLHFYIFSDDADFARQCRFGTQEEEMTVCDWNKDDESLLDMDLMSHCQWNIAANSTFSFWGGRLNPRADAVRIRPLRHRNNQIPEAAVMKELWEGWTLVDLDGKVV